MCSHKCVCMCNDIYLSRLYNYTHIYSYIVYVCNCEWTVHLCANALRSEKVNKNSYVKKLLPFVMIHICFRLLSQCTEYFDLRCQLLDDLTCKYVSGWSCILLYVLCVATISILDTQIQAKTLLWRACSLGRAGIRLFYTGN